MTIFKYVLSSPRISPSQNPAASAGNTSGPNFLILQTVPILFIPTLPNSIDPSQSHPSKLTSFHPIKLCISHILSTISQLNFTKSLPSNNNLTSLSFKLPQVQFSNPYPSGRPLWSLRRATYLTEANRQLPEVFSVTTLPTPTTKPSFKTLALSMIFPLKTFLFSISPIPASPLFTSSPKSINPTILAAPLSPPFTPSLSITLYLSTHISSTYLLI